MPAPAWPSSAASVLQGERVARKSKDIPPDESPAEGFLIAGADAPATPAGYTVLARRYRSRSFDELIGQESIARTLQNAIALGRTAHAYLFCGTRGVGKTSMARVFARALNAPKDLQQSQAVGDSILRGEDLDVIEIDGASNRGVDDARDLIGKAGIAPARSPYRIYIIDEVHMLTTPAFNALLKTMEEPPAHVKFILCTTEPHKVPATIQSRCQRFDFRPIATARIVEHLKAVLQQEGVQAEDAAVHLVARLGNGSMRDALSLLDRLIAAASGAITMPLAEATLGLPDAALVNAISAAAARGNAAEGLRAAARLLESGSPVEQALELLAARFRDLLVLRTCGEATDLVDLSDEARVEAAGQAEAFGSEELVHLIAVCEAGMRAVRGSASPRTVLDATVARVCLHRGFEPLAGPAPADEKKKVPEPLKQAVPPEPRPVPVPEVRDAAEAWARITAAASAPRDAAIVEAFRPAGLVDNTLRLRLAEDAGSGGAFAARRLDPILELVRRVLGSAWRVEVETPPRSTTAETAAPTHGLDASVTAHPLVREAMDAFDAIVLKVDPRAAPAATTDASEEAPT
jgi:DNA polymerase-3 subunit gamma/tau